MGQENEEGWWMLHFLRAVDAEEGETLAEGAGGEAEVW
jgi:hypothetical protein